MKSYLYLFINTEIRYLGYHIQKSSVPCRPASVSPPLVSTSLVTYLLKSKNHDGSLADEDQNQIGSFAELDGNTTYNNTTLLIWSIGEGKNEIISCVSHHKTVMGSLIMSLPWQWPSEVFNYEYLVNTHRQQYLPS